MEIIKLKARPRHGKGKSYSRGVRKEGWVPAVYYGHNVASQNIEIDAKEFGLILRGRKASHLIDLGLSDKPGETVAIIKEIQRDMLLPGNIMHVDFQHAAMDEEVTMEVRVEIVGTAVGVEEEEGVLNHPMQRLTVYCLPGDIPESINVEVTELHVGDAIHIRDISIPKVTLRHSPDEVVASVTHARKEEEVVAPVEGEEGAEEGAEGEGTTAEKGSEEEQSGKDAPEAKDTK